MTMAANPQPAMNSNPPEKLPVEAFIHPMAEGPIKPARFPREFMMAIPAAAAAPDRKAVGNVQKTGRTAKTPKPAIERQTILSVGLANAVERAMKTQATASAKAACPFRSNLASERLPHQTIPTKPTA